MTEINNKLIYEILKKLQDGQARTLEILQNHSRQFIRIREDIIDL